MAWMWCRLPRVKWTELHYSRVAFDQLIGVDPSLVDVGPVANEDIEHINVEFGFEKIKYSQLRHELKQDFVDSTRRSRTRSTT